MTILKAKGARECNLFSRADSDQAKERSFSFSERFFARSILDTPCYISFRCTPSGFNVSLRSEALPTSAATVCHHTTLLRYH